MKRRQRRGALVLMACLLILAPAGVQASYQKSYKLPPIEPGGGKKVWVLPDLRIKVKKKKKRQKAPSPGLDPNLVQPGSRKAREEFSPAGKSQEIKKGGSLPQDQDQIQRPRPGTASPEKETGKEAKGLDGGAPQETSQDPKVPSRDLDQDEGKDQGGDQEPKKKKVEEESQDLEKEEDVKGREILKDKKEKEKKKDGLDGVEEGSWTFGPYAQSIQAGQALSKLEDRVEIIGKGGDPSRSLTLTRDGELVIHPSIIELEDQPGHFLLDPDLFQASGRYLIRLGHGKDCQEISFLLDRDPPLVERGKIDQEGGEARLKILVYDRTGLDQVDPVLKDKSLDSYFLEKEEGSRKEWLSLPAQAGLQVSLRDGVGNSIRFVYEDGKFKQLGLDESPNEKVKNKGERS